MSRRLLALVGLFPLLGCGGDDAPPAARPFTAAVRAEEPLWFEDVTEKAGVAVVQTGGDPEAYDIVDTIGTGAAWLDYDGDGDADLYLAQGAAGPGEGPPDRLFRNDGDVDGDGIADFVDVTQEAGLGDRRWTYGVAVADYDNDGDPDLYLANWGPNRLYRNDGGRFVDVAMPSGTAEPGWGVSAAWADTDRDGDLDLYVTNYVEFQYGRYPRRGEPGKRGEPPCRWRDLEILCGPRNLEPGVDVFYRNDGDDDGDGIPTFVDATRGVGLRTSRAHYGLAVAFFDANGDLAPDLYVANDSVMNAYFVNRGDGTFREMGLISGLAYNEQGHEQAGMGVATGDIDGDGRLDLAVTNFSHDHDTVYRNDGGEIFTDVSYPVGIGGVSYLTLGWGIGFGDLDHDGFEDLFVAHGHVYPQVDEKDTGTTFHQPNALFRHDGVGAFADVAPDAGPGFAGRHSSRAVTPADIDGDGDLDLLFTSLNDVPELLANLGTPGPSLTVRLVGSRSNRDGIGARVLVEAGGRTQVREITTTAGFAAAKEPLAHFGLPAGRADRVEVRWPSGAVSELRDVAASTDVLRVEEPDR